MGNIIFESEYLNGKRNGKGKGCDKYGNLIFEGIYLNGKRWNGNVYDNNHNKIYELINGNGHIIDYCGDKIIFERYYLKTEKIGKGKEYDDFKEKIEFEGY